MYKFVFSNQSNLLPRPNREHIENIHPIHSKSDILVCMRQGRALINYKYEATKATWVNQWNETIFSKQGNYPIDHYPWLVAEKLLPNEDVIILRHPEGIRFYTPRTGVPSLEFLKEDGHFHEVYNHKLLWGRFYPDMDEIGMMTRDARGEIKFYVVAYDSLWPNTTYPVFPLDVNLSFTPIWSSANTDFFVTNLHHDTPAVIGLRTTEGLEFHRFNEDYLLELATKTTQMAKPKESASKQDHIFFANLTNQTYQDILHLNDSGLFVYTYKTNQQNYIFLHHHTKFGNSSGWLPSYSDTIRLFDINEDGRDELIFTGVEGLTVLTFDVVANSWRGMLNTNHFSGLQRFATVVGILPPMPPIIPQTSVFTQDTLGRVQWAKIVSVPATATTPTSISTTAVNTVTTDQTVHNNNITVPKQIARASLPDKPILRWAEQWDVNFLKETVDMSSGQVQIEIPLIDIFDSTGWGMKIVLTYHSQITESNLVGTGWTLPLIQDYIFVDHQNSIYPEDTNYYLVIQGRVRRLKFIANDEGIQHFQPAEQTDEQSQMTITYYQAKQCWTIEGATVQAVYGKANNAEAEDALQWSLGWPNWYGPGRDKTTQQNLVTAWYLNSRLDKHSNRILYYYYEKDDGSIVNGKTYTAALRLKTIRDGQEMQLVFNYLVKTKAEYITPNPMDDQGNIIFPVSLTRSHYLQGYSITTATYSQTLTFFYKVNDGKRLLTGIQQQLPSYNESLLQFNYQNIQEKLLLKSCKSPYGTSIDFNYETLTPPLPTVAYNNVLRYPIKGIPKIAYGSDYAVIAHQYFSPIAGEIILQFMNRDLTQIIINCLADIKLIYPLAKSAIKEYSIKAYQNSFFVIAQYEQKQIIFIFSREEKKWSTTPAIHSFNKKALICFSDAVIAVAEPDENTLKIFERTNSQPDWKVLTINIPRPIMFLALHGKTVISYDDYELRLFYNKFKTNWQNQILETGLHGLVGMNDRTLAQFDLTPETRQQLSSSLQQNGLQIFNNFISLSAIQENQGTIFFHVHLFLLDTQHQVAHKQSFKMPKQNIYQVNHDFKHENSVYQLGYIKEKGHFKVKIKAVSGEIIEEIIRVNDITDEKIIKEIKKGKHAKVKETIKQINQEKGWEELFKTTFLINWPIQMKQQGVYCGNDTLLRITGTGWKQETLTDTEIIRLGKYFALEVSDEEKLLLKLYRLNENQNKQGQPLKKLTLYLNNQLINRYPAYIAYHSRPNTVNVLTFKDDQTLGREHTFEGEQLLLESDWQNLLTIANASSTVHVETQECLIRPASTLITQKPKLFVKQTALNDEDVQRSTGYKRTFASSKIKLTYSETVTMIPGAKKDLFGWYEATRTYHVNTGNITKSEQWYNAYNQSVSPLHKKQPPEKPNTNTSSEANSSHLLDRSGKWLISDFSPYKLSDEMGAYYGFESYEKNQIGHNKSATKTWKMIGTKVIQKGFAFTGENYLQLKNSSFFEGVFQPQNQEITYLAACWIRCSTPLILNTPVSYFRAILSTINGEEIIGLRSQVKYQLGDWFYLELPIDFQLIKEIYRKYATYKMKTENNRAGFMQSTEEVKFQITLRLQALSQQTVDLDHIRFSPLHHVFLANVCNPLTGQPTAIIQTNGLVTRNYYNRLQDEIAHTDEDGKLVQFLSSSRTGRLIPTPHGSTINSKPNILTFESDNGFYESFDTYALQNRWKLHQSSVWGIALGQLWHTSLEKHSIEAYANVFDSCAAVIRCYFALQDVGAALSFKWKETGGLILARQSDTTLTTPNGHTITRLPLAGELIIMLEHNYIWLWIDGVLILDEALTTMREGSNTLHPWLLFVIEVCGQVLIEDFMVLNRPQLKVEYYNGFNEKTQTIQLEDVQTILVTETLYDELGREAITTKTTRIRRTVGHPLIVYRPNFVTNRNPRDPHSVWQNGRLYGEVDKINLDDQGFAYTRTKYAPNPLNEEEVFGLPGSHFSVTGRYAIKVGQHSDIAFLSNLFPTHEGYYKKVEHTPNGNKRVSVFDKYNNQVAYYVRVPSYNHLLSTYEYDRENRLVKMLPPMYHEKVNTYIKLTPWQPGDRHLLKEEKEWQQTLGTHFSYDQFGHLIRKITPDSGTVEYFYNSAGQRRFMVSLNAANETEQIVYFDYDVNDQLCRSGYLRKQLPIATLKQYADYQIIPDSKEYQLFDYADQHLNPLLRGRVKQCITFNDDEPIIEQLHFNAQQQIVEKSAISGREEFNGFTKIKKQYLGDKLQTLVYPITVDGKPLHLVHSYNKLGQLVALGTHNNPSYYASFTYLATGQLATEKYQPGVQSLSFTRIYQYNSPGFLEQISDPFLTERLSYTQDGYGQSGFGDGMVMQTTFNASWPANADGRWFLIKENDLNSNYSTTCINALKRRGYLQINGEPIKLYVRNAEISLPLVCRGEIDRHAAKLIAEKQMPRYYGHRYAYGNHQELVKGKYFVDEIDTDPLQIHSFAKQIPNLNNEQSRHIWQILTKAGYIINNQQRSDPATAIGKRGKSFFRNSDLYNDLARLNSNYTLYVEPIERLAVVALGQRKTLTLGEFVEVFLHWHNLDQTSSGMMPNQQKRAAKEIGKMLFDKKYLPLQGTSHLALDENFVNILDSYKEFIPEIIQVMNQHFMHELGETAFDVESYEIDANGNHKLFYTGFNRYELVYRNATNQIQSIISNWPITASSEKTFAIKHDTHGNIIQALHKGIENITYHPVSQRTTHMQLADGRTLRFYYDAKGERILKRVFTAQGKISHETYYLRDEHGRVIMDRHASYLPAVEQIITAYLYGPRGLLGFIRNNNFYSVTTDHAGSIRLIIKAGRVVAAYDYLPYGQLMRSYGNDPQAHIMYRYTGQEWDEETGLYNYHARLYDPSIGRFYQPDPKAQYFSPYKYAGNSPISVIDPDGEFALLLTCLIFGLVGAYLGGAAANGRWNPAKWDFKKSSTWLGILGGGIAGGLLPLGFGASVSVIGGLTGSTAIGVVTTIGLGAGGTYLSTAASNGNWNPLQWEWDQPHTWNAAFQGFGSGSGIAGAVGSVHNFINTSKAIESLSKVLGLSHNLGKKFFIALSYSTSGALVAVHEGNFAFWKWDWSNPVTWNALFNFSDGIDFPQNFLQISNGLRILYKKSKNIGNLLHKITIKTQTLKIILKNPNHPLYKATSGIVMAYFMGSQANDELNIAKWNMATFSTYEAIFQGVFSGKDSPESMVKLISASKIKRPSIRFPQLTRNTANNYLKKLNRLLLHDIPLSRGKTRYERLMEKFFSSDLVLQTMLQKLKHKSASLSGDAERFRKGGMEKWKHGKNKPPEELERLIMHEAHQKIGDGYDKLTEWQKETREVQKERQEIFPDRDVEFLSCVRQAKRKKRMANPNSCFISSKEHETKPELVELLLEVNDRGISRGIIYNDEYRLIHSKHKNSNGFDPNFPDGFAEHFSLLLEKTPNFHAPTEISFFLNSVLGSILTFPTTADSKLLDNIRKNSIYAKTEAVKYLRPNTRTGGYQKDSGEIFILKICSKADKNTLLLKTFAVEPRFPALKDYDGHIRETFFADIKKQISKSNAYSETELNQIAKKMEMENENYNIKENIYYINSDNLLFVKETSTTKDEYLMGYLKQTEKFIHELQERKIKPTRQVNNENNALNEYLQELNKLNLLDDKLKAKISNGHKLDKTDISVVAEAIVESKTEFSEVSSSDDGINLEKHMDKISKNKIGEVEEGIKNLSTDLLEIYEKNKQKFYFDKNSEAGIHGFFYGILSLNFKYRYGLDIYVERIAGRGHADLMFLSRNDGKNSKNWQAVPIVIEFKSDKTPPSGAIDQITKKGYLYNLSMRTTAKKAIVVGINSNPQSKGIEVYKTNIPQPKGLIQMMTKSNIKHFKKVIEEELKHLYYTVSPTAIKTPSTENNRYLSRLILGEIISRRGTEVYIHDNSNYRNELTTIVFKDANKWTMLNVIESSKKIKENVYKFLDVNIDNLVALPQNVHISSLTRIDIKVNSRSKLGWSLNEINTETNNQNLNNLHYYYQDIIIHNFNDDKIINNFKKKEFTKITPINIDNFFNTNIENEFQKLSVLKPAINSESDFQAILQGLFLNKQNADINTIIKVFSEANLSNAGNSDLVISKLKTTHSGIQEDNIIIMELKYSKNGGTDAENKFEEATNQVFKYESNLKSITDLEEGSAIAAVFNHKTGTIKYEVHNMDIPHTSDSELDFDPQNSPLESKDSDVGIDESNIFIKKQKLNSRKKRALECIENEDLIRNNIQKRNKLITNTNCTKLSATLYNEDVKKPHLINSIYSSESVSSEASKLQFWPINMIKTVGKKVLPFLFMSKLVPENKNKNNYYEKSLYGSYSELSNEQQPLKSNKTTQTLLEMGDQWLKYNDINGLLTWGILLTRKYTGYRPTKLKESENGNEINAELSIRSIELVNKFIQIALKYAQVCGIESEVSNIIDNPKLYSAITREVQQKLMKGQLETIPHLLCECMVQRQIHQITSNSTQASTNKLLSLISDDIPKIRQRLFQLEEKWVSTKQFSTCALLPSNNIRRTNIDVPTCMQQSNNLPKGDVLDVLAVTNATSNKAK